MGVFSDLGFTVVFFISGGQRAGGHFCELACSYGVLCTITYLLQPETRCICIYLHLNVLKGRDGGKKRKKKKGNENPWKAPICFVCNCSPVARDNTWPVSAVIYYYSEVVVN